MVKRPSERTHRHRDPGELNLTALMDIITNLMFFLLLFANIIPVVIIDAPLPKVATTAEEVRIAKEQKNRLEVIIRIQNGGFVVQSALGTSKQMRVKADGQFPYLQLHKHLVALHRRRPKSRDITLIPADSIIYDVIIRTMDASREYVDGDPGFRPIPPEVVGLPESQRFNRLFPDVSIGGV